MWQKGAQRCARAAYQAFQRACGSGGGAPKAPGGGSSASSTARNHQHHHHNRSGGAAGKGAAAPQAAAHSSGARSSSSAKQHASACSGASFSGSPMMGFAANAFRSARASPAAPRATQAQNAWASLRSSGPTSFAPMPQPASTSSSLGGQPMGVQARSSSSAAMAAEGDDEASSCNTRGGSGMLPLESSDDEEDPGTSHCRGSEPLLPHSHILLRHHGPGGHQPQSVIMTRSMSTGSAGGGGAQGRGASAAAGAARGAARQQQQQQRASPSGPQWRPPRYGNSSPAGAPVDGRRPGPGGSSPRSMAPDAAGSMGGSGSGGSGTRSQPYGGADAAQASPLEDECLELRVFAKDAFLSKPLPVPQGVREVLYAHRWDKLLVDVRRAVHLVSGQGKVEEYTAMVAVGNMKGLFGLGLADAPTAQEAVAAAHLRAYGNLNVVPLYRNHTIFHRIEHEYHFLKLIMQPRHSGAGIVASDLLTELSNLVGIRDINIKVHARRRSRMFVATAFQEALLKQAVPHDGVEGSGIYLREVFHKPQLPGLLRSGTAASPAA